MAITMATAEQRLYVSIPCI